MRGCSVDRRIVTFLLAYQFKKFHWTIKPRILKILWVQFYRRVCMVWCCSEEWSIGISGVLRNYILFWGNHCHAASVPSSIRITQMFFPNQTYDTILGYTISGKMFGINKIINWNFPLSGYDDTSYLTRKETSATQFREPKNFQDVKPITAILCVSCRDRKLDLWN